MPMDMLLDDSYQETFHVSLVPRDPDGTLPAPRGSSNRHGTSRRGGRSRCLHDSNRRRR